MSWSAEEEASLSELKSKGLSTDEIAAELEKLHGREFTYWSIQKKIPRLKKHTQESIPIAYKETHEIGADGSHKSDKLLQMTAEQQKNPEYLLRAHGFDSNEWELVTARNNIWNSYSKQDGIMTLYASKITAKPRLSGFDWNRFIQVIENAPKIYVEPKYTPARESYLNIPLFDMHFGISDCKHYESTQYKTLQLLEKLRPETLFIIGSDLFHHNDHRNRTASGREIEHADMTLAWEEAVKFYEPIIQKALETSGTVRGMFIKGNHSETLEWAFTKYLAARFPQVKFDTSFKERKAMLLGNNFIGSTHGDKNKWAKLPELFSTEFPLLWAQAKTREVYTGHEHHEKVEDKGGLVLRQLSTRNKTDKYHEDYGYTTSHKRFQVFEYSRDELEQIHFV